MTWFLFFLKEITLVTRKTQLFIKIKLSSLSKKIFPVSLREKHQLSCALLVLAIFSINPTKEQLGIFSLKKQKIIISLQTS
jgi:hypothetical protein